MSWASRLRWSAVAILTVVATALGTLLFENDGDRGVTQAGAARPATHGPTSTTTPISPAGSNERQAVTARVTEIFAIQDRAFRSRDEPLLRTVFAPDCPCFRAGRERIRQLRADGLRWVGYRSRVSVARVERATDRSWLVTAVVNGSLTRVETDERELLRIVPASRSRWTLLLTRPADDGPLLLASAEAAP